MKSKKALSGSKLLIASVIISAYFISLFLVDYFELDHFLIGFISELFTIPFLLAQIAFLGVGIYLLFKKKDQRNLIILSIVILSLCSLFTFGTMFR
ncbi:hypothetical protein HC174_01305 [Salinimicrobium sp. CDJ15-81-2]|nr:hypothetical protein [Salinimicrobium nanhaiense]